MMRAMPLPAVADLANASTQSVAWLLVVEGIPWCWTTEQELAGSGPTSWIGTEFGPRILRGGLILPPTITTAVQFSAKSNNGQLEDMQVGFEVQVTERVDDLIKLFEVPVAPQRLGARLAPTDDPAPAFGVDPVGGAVALWGRYVAHEAIGPAGERRYYPCIPNSTLPGPDHAALNEVAQVAPVEVTDSPQYCEGRRVALYLLRRDLRGRRIPERDNWPSWSEQIAGGALVWWGTLRRGYNTGLRWQLPCSGPGAWLERLLNINAPDQWRRATPLFELSTKPNLREDLYAVVLTTYESDGQHLRFHGSSAFETPFGATPQLDDIVTLISNTVAGLQSVAGPDGAFKDQYSAGADFGLDLVGVRIDKQGILATGATVRITLHAKVWALLGWDPVAQSKRIPSTEDDVFAAAFYPDEAVATPTLVSLPGPGYWTLYASTWYPQVGLAKNDWDNGGALRRYQPLSGAGALILSASANQEMTDGYPPAEYIEGQLARPPTSGAKVDGQQTDTMRWGLFTAMRRTSEDGEGEEMRAVGRIEWASGGVPGYTQAVKGDLRYRVVQWYDPRCFGHVERPFSGDIALPVTAPASQSLRMVPLAVFGYDGKSSGLDNVVRVLGRLLLSTGTARWQDGALVVGANHHPDALPSGLDDDSEIADLGLAIPASLVDLKSFVTASSANPGGGPGSPLNLVRLAYVGAVQSEEILRAIMSPRHWAWCLRGNRYGLFSWTAPIRFEDVDLVIGESDVAGEGPPLVDLRPVPPMDRITVSYGQAELQTEASEFEHTVASRDYGRAARNGRHEVKLDGRGLPVVERWTSLEDPPPENWQAAFYALWGTRVGPWAATPAIKVTLTVRLPKSLRCQVGTIVRITNPWPATTRGKYGLTNALGRIVEVVLDTRSLNATVEILLQDRDVTFARRFAPIARVVDRVATAEERYDPATKTLYCKADAFRRKADPDVRYFVEPSGFNVGGAAQIAVWQWNGSRWARTMTGTVSSVDETQHSITLSSASGSFLDREYAVVMMRPYLEQDEGSWVREFFLVTTGPAGTFDAGTKTGWQFAK